jgi:predicted alpha/beta superfamily hydrolase
MRLIGTIVGMLFLGQIAVAQISTNENGSKPLVLGVIHEIHSKVLSEKRILNIYLPEGYNPKDTIKYPVIYLLDGAIDEDFIHVIGLVHYNSFPWINRVPQSIVVGIANVDRRRDFTNPSSFEADKKIAPTGGGSTKFISFIEDELQPFIQQQYKTNASKTLIGQSLAGLVATEILFTKPYLFDKYIIISPSLWWNDGAWLKSKPEILNEQYTKPTSIYIGVGKEGITPGLGNRVMEVDANLLADKIKQSKSSQVKVYFDYLPEENHATVTHQAVFNALRLLYPIASK